MNKLLKNQEKDKILKSTQRGGKKRYCIQAENHMNKSSLHIRTRRQEDNGKEKKINSVFCILKKYPSMEIK